MRTCEECGNPFEQSGPGRPRKFCPTCRPPAVVPAPHSTPESRAASSVEKRRASTRRRLVDPTTSERLYAEDEHEFLKAMERYRREAGRPFPTFSEVLEVARSLGYRKVAEPLPLPGSKCA